MNPETGPDYETSGHEGTVSQTTDDKHALLTDGGERELKFEVSITSRTSPEELYKFVRAVDKYGYTVITDLEHGTLEVYGEIDDEGTDTDATDAEVEQALGGEAA